MQLQQPRRKTSIYIPTYRCGQKHNLLSPLVWEVNISTQQMERNTITV